jgi:isocitrate dehydrogenase
MEATLHILHEAGAALDIETIVIGESIYKRGLTSGIEPHAWDSLRRTKVFLKAPITTPLGGGYKSLNVTIRKSLGLYAGVRPCVAYFPFVFTRHPDMDLVIIRENEEDLYAGIEHRQTDQVVQCLKLISRPGCEKIVRYAFEYARAHNRRKVTCLTKDNIMKATDGLFHRVFNEIAAEYPDIQHDHYIIDIGAALLADKPERFDVVVSLNLYGDIISDITSQVSGSVGLGGSANIGEHAAMFEAVHGSAPDIAGRGLANPSGLLLSAVMMLIHIGQNEVAERVQNAWLTTIEDGIHTFDIYRDGMSRKQVDTWHFTRAIVDRLGRTPQKLRVASYPDSKLASPASKVVLPARPAPARKALVGVDVFLDWANGSPDELAQVLETANGDGLNLLMITNRGQKVWPNGMPETFCTDHWRCRFMGQGGSPISHQQIIDLLGRVGGSGLDFIKTENLYTFDGEAGFSLGQGQ